MSPTETEKCLNHPKFKELTRARNRFGLVFSLIIAVGYAVYVLGMSFAPGFMSQSFGGGSMTYGIVIGVLVIISGMVCSGIYTWWANRYFDVLSGELRKELGHE